MLERQIRLHDSFMIARTTERDGLLYRIPYEEVIRIVKTVPVREEDRYTIPDVLLTEKVWIGRSVMEHYSTSPGAGK